MKKGLIGRKLGMTQVYTDAGVLVPVTVIQCGPCTVISIKTAEKDGYSALQLGFGTRKAKNVSKAVIGNVKEAGLEKNPPEVIREVRLESDPTAKIGDVLGADIFAADEFIDVTGTTKGHGFAGIVKRFDANGGRASHGGGWIRRTGSIGCREKPGKVYRGRHMPGHMGDVTCTTQNLKVVCVRPEENLLFVKGAIPGANGGVVFLRNAVKK